MSKKKKDKSNVDQVLGEVMAPITESPIAVSESSDYDAAVHQVEEVSSFNGDYTEDAVGETHSTPLDDMVFTATKDETEEFIAKATAALAKKNELDAVAEDLRETMATKTVGSNLTVSVKPVVQPTTTELIWKGKPAGDMEALLKQKAQQFSYLHFGQEVKVVDQAVLDRCAGDYRFLREIDKLTRTF